MDLGALNFETMVYLKFLENCRWAGAEVKSWAKRNPESSGWKGKSSLICHPAHLRAVTSLLAIYS